MVKSITDKLNYYLSMGNILEVAMCLLKLHYISIEMEIIFISCMTIWSVSKIQSQYDRHS